MLGLLREGLEESICLSVFPAGGENFEIVFLPLGDALGTYKHA